MIIVVEGPDGSGKSTLTLELGKKLREKGYSVFLEREPSVGSPICKEIKDIIYRNFLDPLTEAFLFCASRSQLTLRLSDIVNDYDYIIIDRFSLSTLAYQYHAHNQKEIKDFVKISEREIKPDLIIYLDCDLHNSAIRRSMTDRLDYQTIDFFNAVVDGYKREIENMENVITIDATVDFEEVVDKSLNQILMHK